MTLPGVVGGRVKSLLKVGVGGLSDGAMMLLGPLGRGRNLSGKWMRRILFASGCLAVAASGRFGGACGWARLLL